MKKIVFLVVLLVGCSAQYVIPDGRTQTEFDNTVRECQELCGKKVTGFAFGNPIFVAGLIGGGAIYNGVVEYKFRNCMKEKGYNVQE